MRVSTWRHRHHRRARAAFLAYRGPTATAERARAIAALPSKTWRGQRVYRITCRADFGRGPHDQFVPRGLLWALLDLQHYCCPFHRN